MEWQSLAPRNGRKVGLPLLLYWILLIAALPAIAQSADSILIEEIEIKGTHRTHDWVILQEMSLKTGQFLPRSQLASELERCQQNLFNLNLFHSVEVEAYPFHDAGFHLEVVVIERGLWAGSPYLDIQERNTYDLVGSLLERDFHRLVYGGELQLINFLGGNETLKLYAQLGFSQVVALQLSRPTLARKYQIDAELNLRYRNEHEIIIGTEAGKVQWQAMVNQPMLRSWEASAKIGKRLSLYQRASLQLGYQLYQINDSLPQLEIGGQVPRLLTQASGREFYPTLSFHLYGDRRDWHTFPQQGYKWQLYARLAGPKPIATTQFANFGMSWVHHLPLSKRWNLTYGMQQMLSLGDSIPYFEKHFVGIYRPQFPDFSYELRGYDPYVMDGTFVHMTKVEGKFALLPIRQIRLPFIPLRRFHRFPFGLYLTGFCDVGYVKDVSFNNQDPYWKDQLLVGYGPGLNMVMFFDLLFRVEYAWNRQGDRGVYFNAVVPIK